MRERLAATRRRVWDGIERAVAAEHTPHEIAASFAFGVFVVAMPTAGTAIALFALVAYFVDRASKLALVSTLVIFNPPVKWAVYGAGFWLGSTILGPIGGVTAADVSLTAGYDIAARYLLGNTILAFLFAAVGYVVVFQLVTVYRGRGDPVEPTYVADD